MHHKTLAHTRHDNNFNYNRFISNHIRSQDITPKLSTVQIQNKYSPQYIYFNAHMQQFHDRSKHQSTAKHK